MTHLRLVKPAGPKPLRRKYQRQGPQPFTPDEEARIRASLRNARGLFGTWGCLADAMYFSVAKVQETGSGRYRPSPALVLRLAQALGVPFESLYRAPSDASTCATCGRRS